MFKCAITGQFSKHNEKPIRLTTERRERVYAVGQDDTVNVGRGWEVVKQIDVTLDGLRVWCDKNPDDAESAALYVKLVRSEKLRREAELRRGPVKSTDSTT